MSRTLLTCPLLLWFIASAAPIRAQRPTDQSPLEQNPPEQNQTDGAIQSFELRVKKIALFCAFQFRRYRDGRVQRRPVGYFQFLCGTEVVPWRKVGRGGIQEARVDGAIAG